MENLKSILGLQAGAPHQEVIVGLAVCVGFAVLAIPTAFILGQIDCGAIMILPGGVGLVLLLVFSWEARLHVRVSRLIVSGDYWARWPYRYGSEVYISQRGLYYTNLKECVPFYYLNEVEIIPGSPQILRFTRASHGFRGTVNLHKEDVPIPEGYEAEAQALVERFHSVMAKYN